MTASIGQPDWMTAPETQAVMKALEAKGGPGCARFVGGAVRNTLMDRPVDDIDIATTLTPDEVIQALESAGLRAVPTGIEHGTVTAVANHQPYEITTLRRDVATDGRRAVIAFTTDWAEDAARRDFRFNALYADVNGQVFDPAAGGVEDALNGRVVFVGDPETRLREDYLRSLRFFRFYAWYGRGEPDAAALSACTLLSAKLSGLSAERVQKELLRLLAAPDPRAALRLMQTSGVLRQVLPQAAGLERLERVVEIDLEQGFHADAELRLAALLPDDPGIGQDVAKRLRLSNTAARRVEDALRLEPRLSTGLAPPQARRLLWRMGLQAFIDQSRLRWADGEGGAQAWRALLALASSWTRPTLPVRGRDVLDLGGQKGPAVSRALAAFEAGWIEQDFPADRAQALAELKAILAQRST